MHSGGSTPGEEISVSSALDAAEEVEVWQQVLTDYLTQELASFKSALGAFRQDLRHHLDGLRAELMADVGQRLQATREELERKFVADLRSLYEAHSSGMMVMEKRMTDMGGCLSTRLQALEQKGGQLAGAGPATDLQPAGTPASPVDPGAFPSSPPSPASQQSQPAEGAAPLQTGPSAESLESFLELVRAESEVSMPEATADAPEQKAGTVPPTSPDATPPPCTTLAKVATSLDDLQPALATALEPHMPTRHSPQEKLSALQCAFFSYKFEQLAIQDAKDLHLKALQIQRDGVKDNIWPPGWNPGGTRSLQDFLAEKIKTTLKKKRRASQVMEELRMSAKKARKSTEGHC